MGWKGTENPLGDQEWGMTSGEEGLDEVDSADVEIIKVAAYSLPLGGQRKGDEA